MTWFVSVPCWGEDYVRAFLSGPAESMAAALREAGADATLVVHTDKPDDVKSALSRFPAHVKCLPVPPGGRYEAFGAAHREALALAPHGAYVSLLCADVTVSREFFLAAQTRLAGGQYDMVTAVGLPTMPPFPNPGMASRALLELAFKPDRVHPRHREHFWPGRTNIPSVLYFRDKEGGVVARSFHQHPVAIVAGPAFDAWQSGTCDNGLDAYVTPDRIWTVTDPDELSLVETSPADLTRYGVKPRVLTPHDVAFGMTKTRSLNPSQIELFSRRVVLVGDGRDGGDVAIGDEILRLIKDGALV